MTRTGSSQVFGSLQCVAILSGFILTSVASGVTFEEVARFDVSGASLSPNDPAFVGTIGNNPSAVAWNGEQLYIAGFNSSGGDADTSIAEISNANATGINTATYGSFFGTLSTPNLRGYSGLDLWNGILAAAYDDGGSDPNGIQAFSAASNTLSWSRSARGGSGVGFDPGYPGGDPGMGSGVAWTTFGSGRRALQDSGSGADIWTTADGMIITPGGGTFWRDIDFDRASGDIYLRRSNDLITATRTGDNGVTNIMALVDNGENGPFVNGQNLSFMATDDFGDILIYNDRAAAAAGQGFADVIKVVDTAGTPLSASFVLLDGGTPADGSGYYDFDYDMTTGTLALADFSNRSVHIFAVVPEPATTILMLMSLLPLVGVRRRPVN